MYEALTDFSDIYTAYRRTARGKHGKNEVIKYENNLHMQLWWLQERMVNRTFHIGGYHKFMIYDNAACREGKGTHFAMGRLEGFLRDYYKKYGNKGYFLKFDIRKYFDSICHDVLKKKLERFPDEEVRTLLYHIIDSYEHSENRGVPMGNQSSQWFALYYLDRLDRLIKERLKVKYYVRYMDDGVLIHNDKEFLKKALAKMKELVEEDGLEFNSETQIFPISQGVDFLGLLLMKSHRVSEVIMDI